MMMAGPTQLVRALPRPHCCRAVALLKVSVVLRRAVLLRLEDMAGVVEAGPARQSNISDLCLATV